MDDVVDFQWTRGEGWGGNGRGYGDGQHAWVAAADHFMPVAFGRFLYLESSDCPCHGAATTARPAPPGAPL